MKLGDFIDNFNRAIKKNHVISFFCNCSVRYSGRAESFLKAGDRLIVIKSDNTLLIHQPEKSAPINYMKENTSFHLINNGEHVHVKASNIALKEFLDMEINEIYSFASQKLEDGQKLELQGTEKHMADMIMANPEIIEKGFRPFSQEEQTKFGFIDVFGTDKKGNLVIIECKRYSGDLNAVSQLRRYVEKLAKSKGVKPEKIRGILACPKMTKNSQEMLEKWGYEFKKVDPPKYLERYNKDQKSLGEF